MSELAVHLYGVHMGALVGEWRNFDFAVSNEAIRAFGIDSTIMSMAIPLAPIPNRARKAQRQNFFRETLPEGRMLTRLAAEAHTAERDVIGLLRAYGRDTAGALQIWDPRLSDEPRKPGIEPVDSRQVAQMLNEVQRFPLGNKPVVGKTSLAGVQDKIVLARIDGAWARVVNGYPSTHILKPRVRDLPTVIYDEEYGSRFSRALGLSNYETWIEDFSGTPALVVERFDRSLDAPEGRIHQEDFSQALGASGDEKYQRIGGRVSLARIARRFADLGDTESLERLLRMTVLAVAIGNLDMHTKNIGLLHMLDGTATLAPAYDVVPQAHQDNDGELALAVNGKYAHQAVTRADLVAEAETWGVAQAATIVDESIELVLSTASREQPHPNAYLGLSSDIAGFAANLAAGKPAGA